MYKICLEIIYLTYVFETQPNQTKPNPTKPNQTKPNQILMYNFVLDRNTWLHIFVFPYEHVQKKKINNYRQIAKPSGIKVLSILLRKRKRLYIIFLTFHYN